MHNFPCYLILLASLTAPVLGQEQKQDYFQKWLAEDVRYIVTPQERSVFLKLTTDEERERFID